MDGERVSKAAKHDLLDLPEVVGVGESTDDAGDPILVVNLACAVEEAPPGIPEEVEGVPVYINECGLLYAECQPPSLAAQIGQTTNVVDPRARHRPIRPGSAVSIPGIGTGGTLGFIMEEDPGFEIFATTNAHVVMGGRDERVAQPPTVDTPEEGADEHIGNVRDYRELEEPPVHNPMDFAWIGRWVPEYDARPIGWDGAPREAVDPEVTGRVSIIGGRSGAVEGYIDQVHASVLLILDDSDEEFVYLDDQIIIDAETQQGDSGGPILMLDPWRGSAVGQVVGGGDGVTIANTITTVEEETGLAVVENEEGYPNPPEPGVDSESSALAVVAGLVLLLLVSRRD